MRYKKKELLETITTLEKVNMFVKKADAKQLYAVGDSLIECQNVAIEIGTYIETLENVEAFIVKDLEEYCELLYKQYESLSNKIICQSYCKKIDYVLGNIKKEIRTGVPQDKLEVVFLPYKASMWDCMESVWENVSKDEDCNCYVVPIPYFDKKPDGSLGEMHYEGNQYPSYVPITDWKEYSLADRMPDVIVIHNPYDDTNYVTSVHPDFYATELKKYTPTLIYIPYFVTNYNVAEHFVSSPGVFCADYVIVQSEKVRARYISILKKYADLVDVDGLEDKILSLGSPKFDKVLKTEKSEYLTTLPVSWQSKLGDKKKVVLYNTSIQELLDGKIEALNAIDNALKTFGKNDNITAIWRPHPLNDAVLSAMLPDIRNKYLELIEKQNNSKKDIYDDTADLHRAISISDAYYGDGGSLLSLYGCTGKSMLLHKQYLVQERAKMSKLYLEYGVLLNDSIWFPDEKYNGLFRFNLSKKTMEFVAEFSKEDIGKSHRFYAAIQHNNSVIFAPYVSNNLMIYDTEEKKLSSISLDGFTEKCMKVTAMSVYEDKLFCFGGMESLMAQIDLKTYQVTYQSELYEEMERIYGKSSEVSFLRDCYTIEDRVFLPSCRYNMVCEYCMSDGTYIFHTVGKKEDGFSGIVPYGDAFYLIPRQAGDLIEWNPKTGNANRISIPYKNETIKPYSNHIVIDDMLYIYPRLGNAVLHYKMGTDIVYREELSEYYNEFRGLKVPWTTNWNGKRVYFISRDCSLHIVDDESEEIVVFEIESSVIGKMNRELVFYDRNKTMAEEKYIYTEDNEKTLDEYLNWLTERNDTYSEKQKQIFINENCNGHINCGLEVHKIIRRTLE